MADEKRAHLGNAAEETTDHRGWFVGNFMEPRDVRMSNDVEIKWGVHVDGGERRPWHEAEHRTTVLLLIKGRCRINLAVGSHVLATEGDYAMGGRGVGHSWQAEDDSVVVTIRSPSLYSEQLPSNRRG
jgi:hypothetical protein